MSQGTSGSPDPPAASPSSDTAAQEKSLEKKKKKKDKARAAWISFVGRIVAQVLGAVASVGLGLLVLQRMQNSQATPPAATPAAGAQPSEATRVAATRNAGTVVLAVLPLDNFSGDARQDYFADGMTEALIADLAQLQGLRVISRTSSMNYKDHRKSLPEIAQELGVDLIVEGSVARSGDRVRVSAQLIDAKRDEHIWARSYDRTLRDVFELQAEIASAIAAEVKGAVVPRQQGRLAARRPVDPAVYERYLRGRQAWNQRTADGYRQAVRFFEDAIAQDPEFALAYAGLADTYSLGATPEQRDWMPKAKAAAERAVQLDEGLAEAHTSLAVIAHRQQRDVATADREFSRAIALNPAYATAHQWYSILLAEEGEHEQAARHAQEAVALDPLSGTMHQTLGLVRYYARSYESAIAAERRALALAPHLPLARSLLARALVMRGNYKEAIQLIEQAKPGVTPEMLATLSVAYDRAGDRPRADAIQKWLRAQSPPPIVALARLYVGRGDREAALEVLARMPNANGLQQLKHDPLFDDIRSDPRFVRLTKNVRVGSE